MIDITWEQVSSLELSASIAASERAIDVFSKASGHNGKTHYEGIDCWFCKAVSEIMDDIDV